MRTEVNARRAPAAALGVALALTAAGAVAAPALAASNVPTTGPCTTTGPAATSCELWAKTGTLTLPAGANPASVPIWGYSDTEAGAASAPGPVLVATQGDTVSVTLHNGLAEASSLSFPQVDGFVDDGTGAPAGGTRTYTFTASRPGTFLYQAGLTTNGPRQAAMGLVGALVVRPAADPATLDGQPATAFADEALLVLTEVDDRLNANPTGFDMRTFAPRFRLINGGALSGTTATGATTIGTTAGARLLLRTVNAGLTEHALGALGLRQDVVALGGRSLAHPYNVYAETAQPGQTVDTLVTVPAGATGATYPVYETAAGDGVSGNLANFSGMLAFITTGGTATTGGPAVTGLAVTSNHVAPLPAFPVKTGDVLTLTGVAGPTATLVQYVLDNQAGTWTTAATAPGAFTTDVTVPALTTGQHTVFVRASADGTTFGAVSAVTFGVDVDGPKVTGLTVSPAVSAGTTAIAISATGDDSTTGGSNTVSASYSLDGGAPVALVLNRTNNPVAALTGSVPAAVAVGPHTVAVTALDALGNATGTPATATYRVDTTGPTVSAASISVSPQANDGTRESRVGSGAFTVSAVLTDDVAAGYGEGFFDTLNPTPGTGFAMLANSNATGSPLTVKVDVPLSQLTSLADGPHSVWVRGRDTAGNWGTAAQSAPDALVVDRTAPAIGTVAVAPNPTRGAVTGSVSFPVTNVGTAVGSGTWALTTSGGAAAGNGTLTGSAPGTGTAGTFSGTLTYPAAAGAYTLTVSVVDGVGRTTSKSTPVTVQANRIFTNGFDTTGSPYGWSGRTGTGFTTTATGAIAGARSGTVSLTTSGNYLTDNTPNAETTFHAQFLVRSTGAGAATGTGVIYQAYTTDNGGGTTVFRVLVRRSGGLTQVGILGPTGTVPTADWRTVAAGTGSTLVRVDLAGTTATLTVGSLAPTTATAGSGAGVGSVRLGAVGGATGLGSMLFDSYDSARDRLPS